MREAALAAPARRPAPSAASDTWRRFRRHRLALASLVALAAIAATVALAPPFLAHEFDAQDLELLGRPTPPGAAHWLGTDELGRDMLARLLHGGRISVVVGIAAALVATAIGTTIGAIAGFYRGLGDSLLMRATDVVLSIPPLPLILLLSGLVRPSVPLLVLIIGGLGWMGTARLVRGQFLSLREREFVEAARAL